MSYTTLQKSKARQEKGTRQEINDTKIHMKMNGLYIYKRKWMKILKLPELSDRSQNKCGQMEARQNLLEQTPVGKSAGNLGRNCGSKRLEAHPQKNTENETADLTKK